MTDAVLRDKVEELIRENPVLLFMKGTPDAPRCGFSMRVVQVLGELNVEYGAIDVLSDLEPLREATGEISDWRSSTSTASWSAAPTSSRRCSPRASWPDCSAWSSPRASSPRPRRPRARRGRARRLRSRTEPAGMRRS